MAVATAGCRQSSPIICFGASLTQGKGAKAGHDYPSQLRKMVSVPVINAGISGNTTRDELARLDHDVLTHNPQMVIVTQRNNDCKKNISKQETLKNLDTMIDKIQRHGAIAVLITFEPSDMKCSYTNDFKKLMRRRRALLIENVLNDVKLNPQYMHDHIHPNNAGYLLLAERVYKSIKPYFTHNRKENSPTELGVLNRSGLLD